MKGVLLSQCPGVQVIDLTHDIAPHDVTEAALFLAAALPHFPQEAVHVVVVDPGVGTERRGLAVRAGGQQIVCPDNGVLTLLVRNHPIEEAYAITNREWMAQDVSPTFHGRDVFAPVAARLAQGNPMHDVGEPISDIVHLDLPAPKRIDGGVAGQVIHIDRFGNAVTNIPDGLLDGFTGLSVGDHTIDQLMDTYGDAPPGFPIALVGSTGHLEIALNQGNARKELGLEVGTPVTIFIEPVQR